MKKIGILSDTHAYWDDRYATFLEGCDEIWHAGDVGSYEILERLSKIATVRAVWGNCDGQDVRRFTTEIYRFKVEDANVMIKHIGGNRDSGLAGVRPFAHTQSHARQKIQYAFHQPRSRRSAGLAAGTDIGPPGGGRQDFQEP